MHWFSSQLSKIKKLPCLPRDTNLNIREIQYPEKLIDFGQSENKFYFLGEHGLLAGKFDTPLQVIFVE